MYGRRTPSRKRRIFTPSELNLDLRIADGYYTDVYFNRSRAVMDKDAFYPTVRMQYFQKQDGVCLCGVDESISVIRACLKKYFDHVTIRALYDGDLISAHETAMIIEGQYQFIGQFETIALGILARRTRVATNVYRMVREAQRITAKPVLFFPARFDHWLCQQGDGYAYQVAVKALGLDPYAGGFGASTDAQGEWWDTAGLGTVPHALQAAYGGDVVLSALKFAEYMPPQIKRIILVDYENDSVGTTLQVADAYLKHFLAARDPRYKLAAVRLDTSDSMIDKALESETGEVERRGVTPELVRKVHAALQQVAGKYPKGSTEREFYQEIGIVVSGGFNATKIAEFEKLALPVMAYGVGSSMFEGKYDFTADVVGVKEKGLWREKAKKGRRYLPNERLALVE